MAEKTDKHSLVGALELDRIGPWWIVRFNVQDGETIELGRILLATMRDPDRRERFVAMMQEGIGDMLAEIGATDAHWHKDKPE